jgi:hypothetical protein
VERWKTRDWILVKDYWSTIIGILKIINLPKKVSIRIALSIV